MIKHNVSIIIVTFNSLPSLDKCLMALKLATADIEHELLVVDNCSSDDPSVSIRSHFPEAKIIPMSKNVGFAAACNAGARKAGGEYLLFLNPDVQMDRYGVKYLIAAMQNERKPGAVAGRMRHTDGSFQATCRRFPSIYNMVFSRGSILSIIPGVGSLYTLPDYEETTAVPASAATVMLIRRSLFSRIGGFDERFFMYMEDTDLCQRLDSHGYTNLFVPSAGAVHDWGQGSNAGRIKRSWFHHNSIWKYFMKHLPNGFSLLVLPVFLTMNFLITLIFRRPFGGRRP